MKNTQRFLFTPALIAQCEEEDILDHVLNTLADEKLLCKLQFQRKGKRDDYPIRTMWAILWAGIVYKHRGYGELARELKRNPTLRMRCGILFREGVPSKWTFSRFLGKLIKERELLDEMFDKLVVQLKTHLPDFGKEAAIDSTSLPTYARGRKDPLESADPEADWGRERKIFKRKDGTAQEEIKKWFGYKLHLLVDANYELPIGYKVTKASAHDSQQCMPLVEEAKGKKEMPIEYLIGDKAYDSEEIHRRLIIEHGIKGIIPLREFKDKEEGKTVYELNRQHVCFDLEKHKEYEMVFWGYEKKSQSLKYRCPHSLDRVKCGDWRSCNGRSEYGKTMRIPLKLNYRYYTAIPRETKKWKRLYRKRTSVERINSRVKGLLVLDFTTWRGKAKAELRAGLSLIAMLAVAVSMIKQKKAERMRMIRAA